MINSGLRNTTNLLKTIPAPGEGGDGCPKTGTWISLRFCK